MSEKSFKDNKSDTDKHSITSDTKLTRSTSRNLTLEEKNKLLLPGYF